MPANDYPVVNCPKCNRGLHASGEVSAGAGTFAVYQCDECLKKIDLGDGGEPIEIALTFAVNDAGQVFDPAAPDGVLRF